MDWQPITRGQLEVILEKEISSLPARVRELYEKYALTPSLMACSRNGVRESVFVVARKGSQFLFFDDVEEDFGVESTDANGVLPIHGTYSSLTQALRALNGSNE